MIIRSLCRSRPLADSLTTASSRCVAAPRFRRYTQNMPGLNHLQSAEQNGIPGFLSAKAFKTAWTDYQGHLIRELDRETAGKPYQNAQPKALLVEFARDPEKAYLFNLASMAYNNHQFFKAIIEPEPQTPSDELLPLINQHFSSLSTLRETMLHTAEAMFGPGFVWLVQLESGQLRLLTTYLAGSPLPGAHYRRQPVDMNTQNTNSISNTVGSFGPASETAKKGKTAFGGVEVTPLLCVSTWEHVWVTDYVPKYGFGEGKRRYLENWWDRIHWADVLNVTKTSGIVGARGSEEKNRFLKA